MSIKSDINQKDFALKENGFARILLVENDDGCKDVTKFYLRDSCSVITAENGEKAVQLASKSSFDAILMDINLGSGMSGVETTKEIRKINGYDKVPVIALTAYAMRGDKEDFIQAGCTHFLSKPFTREQLIEILNKCINDGTD